MFLINWHGGLRCTYDSCLPEARGRYCGSSTLTSSALTAPISAEGIFLQAPAPLGWRAFSGRKSVLGPYMGKVTELAVPQEAPPSD